MNVAEFIATLRRDGFTDVAVGWYEPNDMQALHTHGPEVRALVVSGDITIERDGQVVTYSEGEILRIAAGEQHIDRFGPNGMLYVAGKRAV